MEQSNQIYFRTSLGGFHKGDVAAYIAKTASEHQTALKALEQRVETLLQENEILRKQLKTAGEEVAPAEAAVVAAETSTPIDQLELAAYRRAEAAERLALARSQRLYETLDQICEGTSAHLQVANAASQETIDQIKANMARISETYQAFRDDLSAARKKLESLDAMIPDPAEGLGEEI